MNTKIDNEDFSSISDLKYINDKDIQSISIDESYTNVTSLEIHNCPNLITISIIGVKLLERVAISFDSLNNSKISLNFINCKIDNFKITNTFLDYKIENCIIGEIQIDSCKGDYFNILSDDEEKDIKSLYLVFSEFSNIKLNKIKIESLKILDILYNDIKLIKSTFGDLMFSNLTGIVNNDPAFKFFNSEKSFSIEFKDVVVNSDFTISNFNKSVSKYFYRFKVDNLSLYCFGNISIIPYDYKVTDVLKIKFHIGLINCNHGLNISTTLKDRTQIDAHILYTTSCEGILKFGNINFKRVSLIGPNLKLLTSFDHCSFEEIAFRDFENKSTIKFTNSDRLEKLSIMNSELNDVIFRPLTASKIELNPDSFLGGMKIYGSDAINLDNTELLPVNKQEFYRQLKQAAKNSNNKFLELEYKAKEMEHYKPSSCGDKISHWVNSLSEHGTNWVKPLVYLVFWNIVIWLLLSYNLYSKHFDLAKKDDSVCSLIIDLSFGLWIVLNPVSRMSEFASYLDYDQPVHSFVPFLFFCSKLLNGILIYQMISAFRKWVGKD